MGDDGMVFICDFVFGEGVTTKLYPVPMFEDVVDFECDPATWLPGQPEPNIFADYKNWKKAMEAEGMGGYVRYPRMGEVQLWTPGNMPMTFPTTTTGTYTTNTTNVSFDKFSTWISGQDAAS